MNNELSQNSVLQFGKYKGYRIREVLEEEPTYVTEFLVKKLGKTVKGIGVVKKVSDSTWGYKADEGLYPDRLFYKDYDILQQYPTLVIQDGATRISAEGRTLDEAEQLLNNKLNEYYARECRIGANE
jgi:hypothetical protein